MKVSNIEYASGQIIGKRKRQEDACIFFPQDPQHVQGESDGLLCILADGMGGHAGGDVAAKIVCDTFGSIVINQWNGQSEGFLPGLDGVTRALSREIKSNPEYAGMGSTLIALEIRNRVLKWLSVGDSSLYFLDSNGLRRLNADHSMAPILEAAVQRGEISLEEALQSPQRNVLVSAVTEDAPSRIDYQSSGMMVPYGSRILLASDGLETLDDSIIAAILGSANSPKEICNRLLNAVENAAMPKQDNATVMVILTDPIGEGQDVRPTRPIRL